MPLIVSIKGIFKSENNPLADNSATYKYPRKPLINTAGYPYLPARLVHHNKSLTKKWYIQFRVWDIIQQKLIRKRVMWEQLEEIEDIKERYRKGLEWAEIATMDLKMGAMSEKEPRKEVVLDVFTFHGYKLLDALRYAIEIKKKEKRAVNIFRTNLSDVTEFLKLKGMSDRTLLRQLDHTFVNHYLAFLRDEKKIAPKTYNGRVAGLHTMIETLRKLDNKLFPTKNPFAKFDKQKVVTKKHAAFTRSQMQQLREVIEPHDKQLLLFLQFMYFTLGRPKEVKMLKVGHIRMDIGKILFAGDDAKTDIEEYVGISEAFAQVIKESGILNYPSHYYIFTIKEIPGIAHVGDSFFYKRFKKYLNELNLKKLNASYDMYGFKHSGAIALYLATKDPYILMHQCRHTTLDQTMVYLKDLGEFVDFSALNKWTGF